MCNGQRGKANDELRQGEGRWTASSTRQSPMSHSAAEYAAHLGQLAFFHELNGDDRRQHSMRSAAQRRSKRISVATIYVPLPQLSVPIPSIIISTIVSTTACPVSLCRLAQRASPLRGLRRGGWSLLGGAAQRAMRQCAHTPEREQQRWAHARRIGRMRRRSRTPSTARSSGTPRWCKCT